MNENEFRTGVMGARVKGPTPAEGYKPHPNTAAVDPQPIADTRDKNLPAWRTVRLPPFAEIDQLSLVSVAWVDSVLLPRRWAFRDDFKPEVLYPAVSIGYVIHDDDESIILAANVMPGDDGDYQFSQAIRIPHVCIKKLIVLVEAYAHEEVK